MRFEIKKDIYGNNYTFLRAGKIAGKKFLLQEGFVPCENQLYMKKDNTYIHYNNILGGWKVDTVILTSDGRAISI